MCISCQQRVIARGIGPVERARSIKLPNYRKALAIGHRTAAYLNHISAWLWIINRYLFYIIEGVFFSLGHCLQCRRICSEIKGPGKPAVGACLIAYHQIEVVD